MDQSSIPNRLETTQQNQPEHSRRGFVKKAVYVTPLILAFSAKPALAQTGSGSEGGGKGKGK